MAQVRNPRHLKALIAACGQRGVALRPGCDVHRLVSERGRITTVHTTEGPLSADRYLLCSGAWTDSLLEPLGEETGIAPIRGQIALLHTGRPGVRPVILVDRRYLVPREDGRLLVGSTEEEAGFKPQPTAGGIGALLAFAASVVPELATMTLERCWAGLRPGSSDGLPFLGPVPGQDNLFVAAGHFRSGIQLSPGTALLMRELLLGQPPSIPLAPFRLGRPPQARAQTAFRS
jgi:glycine oxidase